MSASMAALADTTALLRFRVSSAQLAIPALSVGEIVPWAATTPIPGAPRHIPGILAVRGEALPLLDLAAFLGLDGDASGEHEPRVLVVRAGSYRVGLLCDGVSGVSSHAPSRIDAPEIIQPAQLRRYATAQIDLGKAVAIVLDLSRVLEDTRA